MTSNRRNYPSVVRGKLRAGGHTFLKYIASLIADTKPSLCHGCGTEAKLGLDHNHATGDLRGWLCHNCNVALGMTHDDPSRLRRLALYLEDPPIRYWQKPLNTDDGRTYRDWARKAELLLSPNDTSSAGLATSPR